MEKNKEKQNIAIVTGATGAIGKAICMGLARLPNYEAVLVARDRTKAENVVEEMIKNSGNLKVRYLLADLSRRTEIFKLANEWQGSLHVLVNNAATSPRQRQETPEGIELQFAVNVLSYFWMIEAFKSHLAAGSKARIVNVASYWAGDLDLTDLEFKRRPYRNGTAYRQSKQADRMLTFAFAERLKPLGITVNACHPGDVNSKLSNDLGFGGHESPAQGAETPIYLSSDPAVSEITGGYFAHLRQEECPFSQDKNEIEELFGICTTYQ